MMKHPTAGRGFVLVWVLLCMGLVGGMLSAALVAIFYERKAILHQQEILRADAAVQAALAAAQSLLCRTITKYPDSASVWEERLPGLNTPGTALHILERADSKKSARVLVLPLISGVQEARELRENAAENPFDFPSERCNFNELAPGNWIGKEKNGNANSICAPWVLLFAGQKDVPLLARYAFILEDESFKLNIQEASVASRDLSPVLQSAKDISLQAIFSQLAGTEISEKKGQELCALRERLEGFYDLRQSNSVLRLTSAQWDRWKYLCTVHSEALNLTRRGFSRININKLFASTSSSKEIRDQLDGFISAVRRESPHWGQRFYRLPGVDLNNTTGVSKKHEEIYFNKLAANIRDFLLPEPHPTRVEDTEGYPVLPFNLEEVPRSENGLGPNPLAAIGKKRIPYLQEYALVAGLVSLKPSFKDDKDSSGAKFRMTLDHFLEFWNLSDKPIYVRDLGEGARLIIRNQPEWSLEGGRLEGEGIPPANERVIDIPLENFKSLRGDPLVFHPGKATVLTTYPKRPPVALFPHGAQFFIADEFDQTKRRFSGVTYRTSTENGQKKYEVALQLRDGGSGDHQTEYLLVNEQGWIDGFGYLPVLTGIAMKCDNGQPVNNILWHIRSSGLQGDAYEGPDQLGDPRTLNEQLSLGETKETKTKNRAINDILSPHGSVPHTRFLRNASTLQGKFPGNSSWGFINFPFFKPEKWPDPLFSDTEKNSEEKFSPAVFPEGPLKTIAELGHVFDPIKDSELNLERDRGGGRTLRIGQPEFYSLWDQDPLSPSREWTAWRLCDIFSVRDDLRLPGAININGVLRAEGAILNALLYDFRWDREGCRELGGSRLEEEDMQFLISHFQKRLRGEHPYENRGGPFFERGEISEIDLFQSSEPFPSTFANQRQLGLEQRNDRVREEIVHYLMEAITTRGNIFSAYCVGQAVRTNGRVLLTRKSKFTFRLVPLDANGKRMDKNSYFRLSDNNRAIAPSRYGIELLARED